MRDIVRGAFAALLWLTACGSEAGDARKAATIERSATSAPAPARADACALLTADEINAATGFAVGPPTPSGNSCSWEGVSVGQVVSTVIGAGMPALSSADAMATWRKKQTTGPGYEGITFLIAPVPDVGVPAIRNEVEGTGISSVEMAVKGHLVSVTAPTFAAAKVLATKAKDRVP